MDHEGVKDLSGNNPNVMKKIPSVKLAHTFAGTGVSAWAFVKGRQPVYITGGGTVKLETTPDGGATVIDILLPDGATVASFSAEGRVDVDFGEKGGVVRFNCTAFTSTINVQIGDSV